MKIILVLFLGLISTCLAQNPHKIKTIKQYTFLSDIAGDKLDQKSLASIYYYDSIGRITKVEEYLFEKDPEKVSNYKYDNDTSHKCIAKIGISKGGDTVSYITGIVNKNGKTGNIKTVYSWDFCSYPCVECLRNIEGYVIESKQYSEYYTYLLLSYYTYEYEYW
ncbi:MAG: hypothetical protein U0264_17605 [Candidatus Kapaibacterium sp.]